MGPRSWGGFVEKERFIFFSGILSYTPPLADVHLASPLGIDGIPLVGVDDNTEES